MNRCKECGTTENLVKYSSGKYRNKCVTHHSEATYTRHLLHVLEKRPWTLWSCLKCDALNSKVRSYCRICKEYTRDESIKKEDLC